MEPSRRLEAWLVRPQAPRLLFPAVILILVVGVVGAYLLLVVIVTDDSVVRTTHRGVDELIVTAHSGGIELVAAPAGDPVRVTRHITKSLGATPNREESFAHGRLKLDYSCDDWPLGHCGIRYVVAVPPGITVRASSGDGDVSAERLAGRRPLSMSSGSGDVATTGVSARSLSVDAGTGDVVLDLAEVSSRLRVDAGSGDVIATLPDVTYAFRAQAPSGGVFNDGVRIDPRSPRRLDIDAGSGEVRLDVAG